MLQRSGQMPRHDDGHGHGHVHKNEPRKRRLVEMDHEKENDVLIVVNTVSKCKVIKDRSYELCVGYHVGDMSMSFDIKSIQKKKQKDLIDEDDGKYMSLIDDLGKYFDDRTFYQMDGVIGHHIRKYESIGIEMGEYIHYFQQFEFDFHHSVDGSDSQECSEYIADLPFRMCMKTMFLEYGLDTVLY